MVWQIICKDEVKAFESEHEERRRNKNEDKFFWGSKRRKKNILVLGGDRFAEKIRLFFASKRNEIFASI